MTRNRPIRHPPRTLQLLFVATAAVLAFGVAVGTKYFGQLERERVLAEIMRQGVDVAEGGGGRWGGGMGM